MVVLPLVAAATAVTLSLTVSSVRNMAQTYHVSRAKELDFTWTPPANAQEAVSRLQEMRRRELLELFLSCEAPLEISEIHGAWNGCLLENNGWIMVRLIIH